MPNSGADTTIREWSKRFRRDPLALNVVNQLRERSNEIWDETFHLLQRESPEYRNSVDEEFTRESQAHCNELLTAIIAVATGGTRKRGAHTFDFVREHAQWRARYRVPLIASMHAYRLAHRTYWRITRESMLRHARQKKAILSLAMLSDFWIEFFDQVGAVFSEAHAVEERLMVAQSTRLYVTLIDDLLRGLEPKEEEAKRLCALRGIRVGAPVVIAVARPLQSEQGKQIDLEVAMRSFVRLVEQALTSATFGKLVEIRNDEVTAVVCSDANTSGGVLAALRRNSFNRRGSNGTAWGVGISLDTIEFARLPEALEEARLALEFASPDKPVVRFCDIDLPELLIRRPHSAAFRLIPEWARDFGSANRDHSRDLKCTIRAFADSNFNVKQTARSLGVHTNTVYFRLNRIAELTGIDPRTYSGTSLLLAVLRLSEVQAIGQNL